MTRGMRHGFRWRRYLHAGLLDDDVPERVKFADTLRRCRERDVRAEINASLADMTSRQPQVEVFA